MSPKLRKKNNQLKTLFNAIFVGIASCIVFSAAIGFLPMFSLHFLILSLVIGFLGICFFVWWRLLPTNWFAKFLYFLALTYYFAAPAFRSFAFILPEDALTIGLCMFGTLVFTHSMPIWNSKTTRLIREELNAPKTNLGKLIFRISIMLLPVIGIPIYFIIDSSAIRGESISVNLIKGVLGWLVALILPFASRSPSSPWESDNLILKNNPVEE